MLGDVLKEHECCVVGPVQVIHDLEQRDDATYTLEKLEDAVEEV